MESTLSREILDGVADGRQRIVTYGSPAPHDFPATTINDEWLGLADLRRSINNAGQA